MAEAAVYQPNLMSSITRKVKFRFGSRGSAVGITSTPDKNYVVSSDRGNFITTLYGEQRGPASGKPPARKSLGPNTYVLKVEYKDEVRFYTFLRVKLEEGAAILAKLNKGRGEHVDSIGR